MCILRGAGESRVGWEETDQGAETGSTKEGVMEERLRRIKKLSSTLSLVRQTMLRYLMGGEGGTVTVKREMLVSWIFPEGKNWMDRKPDRNCG